MKMTLAITLCTAVPLALAACDQTEPAPASESATTSPTQGAPAGGGTTAPAAMPHGHTASGGMGDRGSQQQIPEQPEDPKVASFLGLKGPKPATWIWHPPRNPMITTNYTVPGVDGAKAAHLNVYFFGEGMGGPISDNIERWKNQFRSPDGYEVEPAVEEFEVDGMPVTFVELKGEWMQMGAAWYTKDQLFLAAIIDAPVGRIFIRFAGDEATVEGNRETFMTMIKGLRSTDDADAEDNAAADSDSGGY